MGTEQDAPLTGITVIDFSRVLSGPYSTMLLADMGARVIKIEQPGVGDDTRAWGPPFLAGESAYFLSVNRNKESISLDLKHPSSRTMLHGLLDRADVVVENFRPGTMAHLGLGYEQVSSRWPAIIYCSISGFGQSGPRKAAAGTPYRLGVAISDIVTGMFATQGILLALLARTRTKVGQQVDIGLLDATVALLTYQASYSLTPQRSTKGMISSTTNARTSSLVRSAIAAFSLIGRSEVTWRRPRPRLVRPSTRGGSTEGSSINSM